MGENIKKVELSGFSSTEYKAYSNKGTARFSGRRDSTLTNKKRNKKRRAISSVDATSMLIKCGVCAAACALVLLLKWIGTPATENALQTVKDAVTEEQDLDEMLGKLRFVELPGILEVFSSSNKMMTPILAEKTEAFRENSLLALTAGQNQYVSASLAGIIKEIGRDEALGSFVRIAGDEDRELYLYGLNEITVEIGQPVQPNDYVGSVQANEIVYIALSIKGKPQEPGDYFLLGATV